MFWCVYVGRVYTLIVQNLKLDWSMKVTRKRRVTGKSDLFEQAQTVLTGNILQPLSLSEQVVYLRETLLLHFELFTAIGRNFSKKMLLIFFCKFHRKTPASEYLFNQHAACYFFNKVLPTQVLSCEFCKILSHFLDKPSISKDIFLIYLVYRISETDILSISKFKHLITIC